MFNGQKKPQDPIYFFDLKRHYKIWFSTTPHIFLGMEDQLRFIRMREENPKAVLHFIYSKICLFPQAFAELIRFCTQYDITPVAFEDLEADLQYDQDKALYKIAQQELIHCIDNKEGNMASASDCVRLLETVIAQYGIYSDFDVGVNLSKLPEFVALRGPLLFPADILILDERLATLSPNSDFFACSFDQDNPEKLSEDALTAIQRVQAVVLKKYQPPFSKEKIFGSSKLAALERYPELPRLFKEFHSRYPNNPTVYDFRSYVKALPNSVGDVSNFLMKLSVINISGPGTYPFLFKLPHEPEFSIIPHRDEQWLPFLKQYELCSTGFYDPIYNAIISKNSIKHAMASINNADSKPLAELSWTQSGMHRKQKREEHIANFALMMQGFWRQKLKNPSYKLYLEVKKITSLTAILVPIKENMLALALRRACSGIKLDVVQLLVKHYHQHPFNVNERSSKQPNTALDWIINAKTDDNKRDAQQKIINLLKSIGAKTATEIIADQSDESKESPKLN